VSTEFTTDVTTAAVTCGGEPRLLLNPEFLERHCQTEAHVKAVICHEFLHVLLRHTEGRGPQSWAEHLALDAVINAIIHRTLGAEYSSFMSLFYARAQGVAKLLRPCPPGGHVTVRATLDRYGRKPPLEAAWSALYDGRLLADDIRSLANDFASHGRAAYPPRLDRRPLCARRRAATPNAGAACRSRCARRSSAR
jgi:hypothetical protein